MKLKKFTTGNHPPGMNFVTHPTGFYGRVEFYETFGFFITFYGY
jgi:hypothetical protein